MQLLAELKRRNVIRMAGLYLVGAWLIVQVAETLLPIFDTPGWVLKALVALLALGFVPALAAAWVFEMTPDGLRRDTGADAAAPPGGRTTRRMDALLLVGMLAVVAMIVADRMWPSAADPADAQQAAADVAAGAEGAEAGGDPGVPGAADSPAAGSGIGVLPFDNLSPDPDNAFFASGIHEEVLSRLARVEQLRVISRTSMQTIAAEELSVPEIGRRLGVSHVLEGSVRRIGDKVRITVQLIEAATDRHVWAENYDRTLDDVFAIQSEIALAITDQLQVALSAGEQQALADRPTENAEAYDFYLRAVDDRRVWRAGDGFRTQIALLEPAVALDPDFTQARRMLAEAYGRMTWLGLDADGTFRAKAAAQVQAISKSQPDSFDARLAQAMFDYTVERDYARALATLQELAKLQPNHAEIALNIAGSLKRLRRFPEQLVAIERASALDPESPMLKTEMVIALGFNGRYDEAVALSDEQARRYPEDPAVLGTTAAARLMFGGDRAPIIAAPSGQNYRLRALALFSEGDIEAAQAELQREGRRDGVSAMYTARVQAEQAALLRLAGRDTEAAPLARAAFATARAWVDAGRPDPEGLLRFRLANAAFIAAIAGEDADAAAWAQLAQEQPPVSLEQAQGGIQELAEAARWRGDVDGAWSRLAPLAGQPGLTDPQLRALRPYYDAMYGESAEYRAYMAKL